MIYTEFIYNVNGKLKCHSFRDFKMSYLALFVQLLLLESIFASKDGWLVACEPLID